jgi:DNA ligase-1
MKRVAELFDALYFTQSHKSKSLLLREYLATAPDPERGYVIAMLAGELNFKFFKRNTIKQLMLERVDETLFALSYDYIGEMSETVAHLWPSLPDRDFVAPLFDEVVEYIQSHNKTDIDTFLVRCLNNFSPSMRWSFIKIGTGGLRVGLSARRLKQVLAEYGNCDVAEIEQLWHGISPPYLELLAWLEGRSEKPDIRDKIVFHPVMLAHPLLADDIAKIDLSQYIAEYKYDGIRIQVVNKPLGKALFSRTGDDISHSFPDVLPLLDTYGVFDAELLAFDKAGDISTFNQLQQRLNKKKPSRQLQNDIPCGLVIYDVLEHNGEDVTQKPLFERQSLLRELYAVSRERVQLSNTFSINNVEALHSQREQACLIQDGLVEGLMLKKADSPYIPGRPKGIWYKFKRDPKLVDAVVMYAQRGHGKRSSFYSDFTFGLWADVAGETRLLPIGKAYSGFTDAELKELDKWVRKHTIGRFGPVKEVEKTLVFEVAFDGTHESNRHKSGVALRFPRVNRIRWDKPAIEADTLSEFKRSFLS